MVSTTVYGRVIALVLSKIGAKDKSDDKGPALLPCSGFTVNGSHDAFFSFHRYWDFGQVKKADNMDFLDGPRSPRNELRAVDPFPLTQVVTNASWTDDWTVREWYREAAREGLAAIHYVPKMVSIGGNGDDGTGFLTLNTTRLANDTQQGGEIFYSPADVTSVSLRVSARVNGATGAVAGFFTYENDTQESDIEILTRDANGKTVHFSNQPTTLDNGEIDKKATFNKTIPKDATFHDWTTYRLDWFANQDHSAWYINGKRMAKTDRNVPQMPSTVFIDMWSNGGAWSGVMPVDEHALLEIQWVEMVFNASLTPATPAIGAVTCTIDEVVGTPVPAGASRLVGLGLGVLATTAAAAWVLF